MVVLFIITMILLPVVACAGAVSSTSGNETDHLALLAIKSAIKDPLGALTSWNHSLHHCYWEGVTCGNRHRRVVALNLSSSGLAGAISPHIGNLSFLRFIDLSNNALGGPIPAEIGSLSRLSIIYLYDNFLIGEIPSSISNCSSLQYLSLRLNLLVGGIPLEFSSLSMLKGLFIGKNNFSGPIFSSILNLTSLEELSAEYNAFMGIIPDNIDQMKNLVYLALGANLFTGMLPSSIYNLSSITTLSLSFNQLHGTLPPYMASALPHLKILELQANHFTGSLPISLSNISSLTNILLTSNKFTGGVPWNLGNLRHLQKLLIGENSLGTRGANDLNFLNFLVNCTNLEQLSFHSNNFRGVLPNGIANFTVKLKILELDDNVISGRIPVGIDRLANLVRLVVEKNKLSGTIPNGIGKLQKLEVIYFGENMFTGIIPWSLGNITKLSELFLNANDFQGDIPSSLGNCQNLNYLVLSQNNLRGAIPKELFEGLPHLVGLWLDENHLEGPLPLEISRQKNLVALYIANNKLSGEIPSTIGGCSGLLSLYMEGNMFYGHIVASLDGLKSIQELDLSHNDFSGPIPTYLSKFPLTYLNLSYNYFEGEVPVGGVFVNTSAVFLVGNPQLCGGILALHLPRCTAKDVTKAKISFKLRLIISCACALAGVAIVFSVYFIYSRKKRQSFLPVLSFKEHFLKVSYKMLLKATEGFSSSNLLGTGRFGSVFKGVLEDNQMTVAVKVLNLQQPGASKSFVAECEALRNTRHRNLVKVITACSSVDYQGNDFKAIVYEFMHGGSLESWLHSNEEHHNGMLEVRGLNLLQRVNIALDVASALEYLHNDCEVLIVHRDLKPSNILLDKDMVAHVGDFGLARFLLQSLHPSQSSSTGVKGTVGYVAPECGLGGDPSAASDIYSYGVMVLEMMTGKRPTDDMFKEGLNLHTYVKMALPDQVLHIVDTRLLDNEGHVLNNIRTPRKVAAWMNCVMMMMKIGVACSMESLQDRISLKDALAELLKVKDNLIQFQGMNGLFFHHHNFELNQVVRLCLPQTFETKIRSGEGLSGEGERTKVAQKCNSFNPLLSLPHFSRMEEIYVQRFRVKDSYINGIYMVLNS